MKKLLLVFYLLISFISYTQTNTFDGSTDNDWHKSCNWSLNSIPTCLVDAVIPTGLAPNISGIAHCRTIELQGTADVNITGVGVLEVSSVNTCIGTATNNGGCTVPGSSWSGDGNTTAYCAYSRYCICPCSNTGGECMSMSFSNNTSFPITLNLPNMGCATWTGGSTKVIPALSSISIQLCAFFSCCPPNTTNSGTWSSSDGASGNFSIETCNIL